MKTVASSERIGRTARRRALGAAACLLLVAGCGTGLDSALSGIGLLPDASSISLDVRQACDGVMTESQMLTSITAARIDRFNGVTKSEDLASGIEQCGADALVSGIDYDACVTCKQAILDEVFGR